MDKRDHNEIKLVIANINQRDESDKRKDVVGAYIKRKTVKRETNKKQAHNRINYVGRRYGMLVVEEVIYEKMTTGCRGTITKFKCKCDCGNEKIIRADSIRYRNKRSCGCNSLNQRRKNKRKDITGEKYGRLTVLEMIWGNRAEGTRTKCRCICECGAEVIVSADQLKRGNTGSCGCYNKDVISKIKTKDWTGIKTPFGVEFVSQAYQKNKRWFWNCICPSCGEIFVTMPSRAMSGNTRTCGCETKSRNEIYIGNILNDMNINYVEQYSFPDCKNIFPLKFDFAIFDKKENISFLLEYDGVQHYKPVEFFGGDDGFKIRKKRDQIKNKYCQENGIDLLRIPYFLSPNEVKSVIVDKLSKH